VKYVYDNRFVIGEQVQERFPEHLRTPRTRRHHLKALVDRGSLAVVNVLGAPATWPHVYCCTAKGSRFSRDLFREGTPAASEDITDDGMTRPAVHHELLVTQFALDLSLSLPASFEVLFQERRWSRCERPLAYTTTAGLPRLLLPDFGYLLRPARESNVCPLLTFVEVDMATESLRVVRDKLAAYARWGATSAPDYLRPFYGDFGFVPRNPLYRPPWRLLIIAHDAVRDGHDRERELNLATLTTELPSHVRNNVWLTTVEQLAAHTEDDAPLSAPLFVRARDVAALLPRVQALSFRRRRALINPYLDWPPRYSLFTTANTV
jgi:hypothetical protein